MTSEQFDRWRDFTLRMALACYADSRRPSRDWVVAKVEGFFDYWPADDTEGTEDWDHSVYAAVTDFLDNCQPWSQERCPHCRRGDGRECTCDEIEERVQRRWDEQWGGPVRCCIRAGLDVAVSRSGGVLGFTAGDLRRMYPEGVPDWIARQWDDAETIGVKAVVSGVGFIPEVVGTSPRFEEMPDDSELWL